MALQLIVEDWAISPRPRFLVASRLSAYVIGFLWLCSTDALLRCYWDGYTKYSLQILYCDSMYQYNNQYAIQNIYKYPKRWKNTKTMVWRNKER